MSQLSRHTIAAIGSFIISTIIQFLHWSLSNQNLEDPTADTPIIFYTCCCSLPSIVLSIIVLPLISNYLDLFVSRWQWYWWQHTLFVATIFFVAGILLASPVWLGVFEAELTFVGQLLIPIYFALLLSTIATSYWLIYQGSKWLFDSQVDAPH